MPSLSSFLSLSVLLAGVAQALPTGAPKCAINQAAISAAHSDPSAAGYTITTSASTYTPGAPLTFTIQGDKNVVGVLMYVSAGEVSKHVGAFKVPENFRVQNADICTGAKIVNDAPESTITHANPTPKGTKVDFTWTAPAADQGPLTLHAVVASGGPGNPWQILDVVTLNSASGGSGSAPTTVEGGAASTAAPVPTSDIDVVTSDTSFPTGTIEPSTPRRKCHKKNSDHASVVIEAPSATVDSSYPTATATSSESNTGVVSSSEKLSFSGVVAAVGAFVLGLSQLA
ncbi:uncharacterized protein EV422DRAFT_575883 [Fimicolochytrium jonesii]|uniref:uncharacterized protein n=1 Tax=Fimicolochytrium jonesii TaxID=1396493 RepID=UPI0022FDEED5|nr:uncharacterized protein EV422DRAFT_575883 [Fimicolochytrium jonesii]KAI8826046.1 hypothetical protein EV422DRAFT_575883 [Fimicolochytrium jonesii]